MLNAWKPTLVIARSRVQQYNGGVAYTIQMTVWCLQFAASSEQEVEMITDPAVAELWGHEARIALGVRRATYLCLSSHRARKSHTGGRRAVLP